jgi:hypothetical protein
MRSISAARLPLTWERAVREHPLRRALILLQLGEPDRSVDELALLSVGERDRRLIEVRESLIGGRFDAAANCPNCAENLEMSFTADELRALPGRGSETISVECEGYSVVVRPPNTADLLHVIQGPPENASLRLLERCVLVAQRGDAPVADGEPLPLAVVEAAQSRLMEADPIGDLQLALRCPGCSHSWMAFFDIAAYFWVEVADRVKRLLSDTHTLAKAYGWSESDILDMSEVRRQCYLDMVAGQ